MNHAASSRLAAGTVLATVRVSAKLAALALISVPLLPLQWLLMRCTRGRGAFVLPRLWFACVRRLMGIRVERVGVPRSGGGTLFVGNHLSHFDIVVLGSLLRARFIAKNDMERWPGMRRLGALAQTLFISRRRIDAANVAAAVAAQIRPDHDVVLFAEGTTSSGERVAAFKSSLFSLFLGGDAHARPWTLQAFTLQVLSVDGRPLAQGGERDAYAFYGTMQAGAHVLRFLGMSGAVVRVTFHAPIALDHGADRKVMAQRLHAIVASALPAPRSDGPPA
ncbi:lysophospholipid acyltransferase family protein [Xanthomonas translucens]|uniref:1-acyl-sn-glycerol-3-phosphate acyltransferase n=3 Tax=Xanthomonas campestris pv. translucens TaxID=343 RepID=A0A109HKS2_XANCT|nr:lysophospholipid acyltransferase family protein [Xanthomonas translucens]UKE58023.1 1-acyl-sn-glycerol-3-phosphate acyltransferase [Xanthomonas translucens pv. hordei]CCP39754.1 1-acyl-sn-glycerol-3-phosphate acyltransferase [Xanthomonas translucens pv. translucens DSM 18974]KTF38300.1 1-acyl-sn-glycerol-3-phosphate acyltransferase [Xanthomonas translucens pv. translucens]KWV12737.1 1-acyl-sn-glycerol-3-phosphate acyltransferase [Xanthomonas translucens]KWV13944.1 1-acyl-sn-glycerol-3-phosp